jgi:hypothetical protein
LFVAGLAVIRAHNLWIRGWPVLVTLVGWFVIFLCLFRMFAPELFLKSVQHFAPAFLAPTMGALLVGIYLTFKAYTDRDDLTRQSFPQRVKLSR